MAALDVRCRIHAARWACRHPPKSSSARPGMQSLHLLGNQCRTVSHARIRTEEGMVRRTYMKSVCTTSVLVQHERVCKPTYAHAHRRMLKLTMLTWKCYPCAYTWKFKVLRVAAMSRPYLGCSDHRIFISANSRWEHHSLSSQMRMAI